MFLIGVATIKITVGAYCIRPTSKVQCYRAFYTGVCNTPLRSSPQCYRSRVGMLTIICVDTYNLKNPPRSPFYKGGSQNHNTFTVSIVNPTYTNVILNSS